MFLSLCQKDVNHDVFEHAHNLMYKITNNIIKLPEGYTKWVIHEKNISYLNNKKKVLEMMTDNKKINNKNN